MKKILVACDNSGASNRAVTFAAKIAVMERAKLSLVAIGEIGSSHDLQEFARIESGTVADVLEADARLTLDHAKALAAKAGVEHVETFMAFGDVAAAILDTIKASSADVLVVGKRGRGRIAGLLLGSVSQKLAALAPCTVAIVP